MPGILTKLTRLTESVYHSGWIHFARFSNPGLLVGGVFESVAVIAGLNDVAMAGESIQQCRVSLKSIGSV